MSEPVIIGDAHLYLGDCIEVMRGMADNSVDSIVTDPPYEIGFMGKSWDASGIAYNVDMWREALRVLKPGGHLLAFSGSRTYHRMTCAIEDAGFEVRDQIMWVYGSGFPKSHNLDGEWAGWGTALKPAHEPICVARKPLVGTVAANVLQFGTGALNIEQCRVPSGLSPAIADALAVNILAAEKRRRKGEASTQRRYAESGNTNFSATPGPRGGDAAGRWPANLIHDGSPEVISAFPEALGQQGDLKETGRPRPSSGRFGDMAPPKAHAARRETDTSAARFFYCAKASRADRNEGVGGSDTPAVGAGATMREREDADWEKRNGNHHPTVKPTDLMAYLVRLVTPPSGLVLDMFMGSGSTGKAATREGLSFAGIELNQEYVQIATARIEYELAKRAEAEKPKPQMDLFAEAS